MKEFRIFLFLLTISLGVKGQQSEFFTEDNSFHQVYQQQKIKERKLYATDFKILFFNIKYLESIHHYDTLGNLIKVKKYLDRDKLDGWEVYFYYDNSHRLVYDEWYWLDDRKWDKKEYSYNQDGQVISVCKYHKQGSTPNYTLASCKTIFYVEGRIEKILQSNNDSETHAYFSLTDSTLSEFSSDGEIKAEYIKDLKIKYYSKEIIYNYKYNQSKQLVETITTDKHGNVLSKASFTYKNGLPFKNYYWDSSGKLNDLEKYKYKKYRKISVKKS
ncbi:hypothetical protein [Rufibacter sp. LB8]|uniref:hypothetical protein n=1 Tax=Rufibacter sp. LB8 TaxID=2777781 RepID=UPI00178C1E64|nr:hypothetical protein [Rufibacter sp. LB8]